MAQESTSAGQPQDPLRLAEIERLHAEKNKFDAEQQRILIESEHLRRPWWKQPAYAQAVVTPLLSVIIIFATWYFAKERADVQAERNSAVAEMKAILRQRDDLQKEVAQLNADRSKLAAGVAQSTHEIEVLRQTKESLESDRVLGNTRAFVEKLRAASADNGEDLFSRYMHDLLGEIQDEKDQAIRQKRIAYLTQQAASTENGFAPRIYMLLALGWITQDSRFQRQAMRLAVPTRIPPRVMANFWRIDVFTSADRAEFLCSAHPLSYPPDFLSSFDSRAQALCPAPFLANVISARTEAANSAVVYRASRQPASDHNVERGFVQLAQLSPQAAICLAVQAQIPATVAATLLRMNRGLPTSERSLLSNWSNGAALVQWKNANTQLCRFWMDPDLDGIKSLTTEDQRRLIEREWVDLNSERYRTSPTR